jgi:hypothetical protein
MPAAGTTRRRTSTKPAKVVEPEEVEDLEETEADEDEELEEMDEDEVADTKPTTKKSTASEVTFGIRDLVAHIKEETGQDTDPRGLRTLIRKMARDGSGRVDREIKAGNRTRYDWSGPNDPEVVKIVTAFKAGELEQEKQAKLAALKEQKAKKTAAKKAAQAEELPEEDDEEVEEKPAPRRRAAKKTTAGAPKTTTRTRRKAPEPEVVEDDEELDLDDDE